MYQTAAIWKVKFTYLLIQDSKLKMNNFWSAIGTSREKKKNFPVDRTSGSSRPRLTVNETESNLQEYSGSWLVNSGSGSTFHLNKSSRYSPSLWDQKESYPLEPCVSESRDVGFSKKKNKKRWNVVRYYHSAPLCNGKALHLTLRAIRCHGRKLRKYG